MNECLRSHVSGGVDVDVDVDVEVDVGIDPAPHARSSDKFRICCRTPTL